MGRSRQCAFRRGNRCRHPKLPRPQRRRSCSIGGGEGSDRGRIRERHIDHAARSVTGCAKGHESNEGQGLKRRTLTEGPYPIKDRRSERMERGKGIEHTSKKQTER